MLDKAYLQKTIRAYISLSVVMKSDALSPKSKEYLRDLSKTLEEEIAALRTQRTLRQTKVA